MLSSCTRAVFLPSLAPGSSEGVSSETNEGEQFLSGSTGLMGFLLGLIPEKSPVGSPPECFLLDLLSLRGIKHWKKLLLRIKANIGIIFFDLKKKGMWVRRGARGKAVRVAVLCLGDRGQLSWFGTFCFQEPPSVGLLDWWCLGDNLVVHRKRVSGSLVRQLSVTICRVWAPAAGLLGSGLVSQSQSLMV